MNDMSQLSDRTEALIQRVTESMITAGEKVMEGAEKVVAISTDAALARIDAAVGLAEMKATLQLRVAQIEAIGNQKGMLADLREKANGNTAMVKLLDFQLSILTAQELGVLMAAGIPSDQAVLAVAEVDKDLKLYHRDGRRFAPVAG